MKKIVLSGCEIFTSNFGNITFESLKGYLKRKHSSNLKKISDKKQFKKNYKYLYV